MSEECRHEAVELDECDLERGVDYYVCKTCRELVYEEPCPIPYDSAKF